MTPRPPRRPAAGAIATRLGLWVTLAALTGSAQAAPPASGIYTCVDAAGRRHTSDRPIPECLDREQSLRNGDGSVRRTVPPSYSAEERAAQEERRRRAEAAEEARKDRARHDRNLLARYPDVEAHQRAREAALESLRLSAQNTGKRLAELEREKKSLANEAEFYAGREMPRVLKNRIEANRATMEAQRAATNANEAEKQRINARYDEELAHLRQLWGGAALGAASAATGPSTPSR